MASKEELEKDVHDLLHIVARAKSWVDTIEITYLRHLRNARNWFNGLEGKIQEIAKDLSGD